MNRYIVSTLLFILSLSGWISGAVFYYQAIENDRYLMDERLDTSFNIISQMLQRNNNDEDVLNQVNISISKGWSAHTGSLTTLCENDKHRLLSIINESNVDKVCALVPKGDY
ncbi:hypothetical protein C9J12_02080 [Photobacterium frigidiphilum]|uniref:Uncharacterized protein n=1 Tax=Photobacterium frigidiphilum TaxID=264736 RepID=A0A2T3JRS4_9GAMM|nr:hypothetical protein [Photobacterium frigidiphilum]PSU51755.1 hypothetical protein C9J12_02080 [Photobacterium frigidiphilum]